MTIELLPPGSMAVGSVLAAGGVAVAVVERLRRIPLNRSVLVQRWLTWAVLGPLWVAAAVWPVAMVALLTAFAIVATREYGRLRPGLVLGDRMMLNLSAAVAVPLLALGVPLVPLLVLLLLRSTLLPLLAQDVAKGPQRVGDGVLGVALVIVPVLLIWEIGAAASTGLVLAVGLGVALSDVGAFVIGSVAASRSLAPTLSPNKTRAGLIGNFGGAAAGVAIITASGALPWGLALAVAPLIAIGAVWGDLLESLLKRSVGVKDAGAILPGFGGLLDRIDSLLVVAPLVYVLIGVWGGTL